MHNAPNSHPRNVAGAAALWLAACAVFAAARYRAQWPHYRALHERLHEAGVPESVRALDHTIIMLGAAFLGSFLALRLARKPSGVGTRNALMLTRPRPGWARVTLIASTPMLLGGLILMLTRDGSVSSSVILRGVIRAPLVEEIFFRGLMVAVPAVLLCRKPAWTYRGPAFWGLATCSALVFGSGHITWTGDGLVSGWPNLLVTSAGGVWYAWLMRAWRSLAVPIALHAAMNLGWMLAGTAGGAGGGGLLENTLRASTIALATWLTIRSIRTSS